MNTKFELGQTIFYVGKKREMQVCDLCEGKKTLELANGNTIECPKCHGVGEFATSNIIDGDVLSFEPNIIQIQHDGVFYAHIAEAGNTLHAIVEQDAFLSELEVLENLKNKTA